MIVEYLFLEDISILKIGFYFQSTQNLMSNSEGIKFLFFTKDSIFKSANLLIEFDF
jgi:hypothetical protein